MKRSRRICLTLLASLSLAACSSEEPTERAVYMSRQDCIEDWGSSVDCDDDDHDGRWRGPHYYYYGGRPYYYSKKGGSAVPVPSSAGFFRVASGNTSSRAVSVVKSSVSRGGFGRSSSFHSASS